MVARLTSSDVVATGRGTYRLRTAPGAVPVTPVAAAPEASERDVQAQIEQWLAGRGYRRLTAAAVEAAFANRAVGVRGWFGHWTENRRNPLVADLLVVPWPNVRCCLLLELKAGVGAQYQPGQKAAILLGLWWVAYDFEQAVNIVEQWENQREDRA